MDYLRTFLFFCSLSGRNSDPGSLVSRFFSPPPYYGARLRFYRETTVQHFFFPPSPTRVEYYTMMCTPIDIFFPSEAANRSVQIQRQRKAAVGGALARPK